MSLFIYAATSTRTLRMSSILDSLSIHHSTNLEEPLIKPSDEALQQSRNSDYGDSNCHLTLKISLFDDEN